MILVEQNIARGLDFAERAYVLSQGQIALSGEAAAVRADPALASLYVGESARQSSTP
jgi:branched-chain amino acid transport system ATP-binding protein